MTRWRKPVFTIAQVVAMGGRLWLKDGRLMVDLAEEMDGSYRNRLLDDIYGNHALILRVLENATDLAVAEASETFLDLCVDWFEEPFRIPVGRSVDFGHEFYEHLYRVASWRACAIRRGPSIAKKVNACGMTTWTQPTDRRRRQGVPAPLGAAAARKRP